MFNMFMIPFYDKNNMFGVISNGKPISIKTLNKISIL